MGGIVSHKTMLLRVAGDGASYRVKITVGVGRPMSALGQKQTLRCIQPMSALLPKADIHVAAFGFGPLAVGGCRTDKSSPYGSGGVLWPKVMGEHAGRHGDHENDHRQR
jgi:hypothetical protein